MTKALFEEYKGKLRIVNFYPNDIAGNFWTKQGTTEREQEERIDLNELVEFVKFILKLESAIPNEVILRPLNPDTSVSYL